MDFKKKKEELSRLSSESLAESLVLLGDWLPVARQVVAIKAAFACESIDLNSLEEALRKNLTITEYIDWKQSGAYSLIIGEVHEQLKLLAENKETAQAKALGELAIKLGEQSSELLAEADYWEMGLDELREWLNEL